MTIQEIIRASLALPWDWNLLNDENHRDDNTIQAPPIPEIYERDKVSRPKKKVRKE